MNLEQSYIQFLERLHNQQLIKLPQNIINGLLNGFDLHGDGHAFVARAQVTISGSKHNKYFVFALNYNRAARTCQGYVVIKLVSGSILTLTREHAGIHVDEHGNTWHHGVINADGTMFIGLHYIEGIKEGPSFVARYEEGYESDDKVDDIGINIPEETETFISDEVEEVEGEIKDRSVDERIMIDSDFKIMGELNYEEVDDEEFSEVREMFDEWKEIIVGGDPIIFAYLIEIGLVYNKYDFGGEWDQLMEELENLKANGLLKFRHAGKPGKGRCGWAGTGGPGQEHETARKLLQYPVIERLLEWVARMHPGGAIAHPFVVQYDSTITESNNN